MVQVLTADDQPRFLAVARELVGAAAGFELIGEASTGEEAVALATELRPDLVLMDVNMPGIGGVEAARRITAARLATLTVLVSAARPEDLPRAPVTCGAIVRKEALSPHALSELWSQRAPAGQL